MNDERVALSHNGSEPGVPLLELSHASKDYRAHGSWSRLMGGFRDGPSKSGQAGRIALDDVSVSLNYGECLAIIGESGSGKTTLTRIMLGLLSPSIGELRYQGRPAPIDAEAWKLLRRESSMIFQNPYSSLDPRWTVRKSLKEALSLRFGRSLQASEIDERCVAMLDDVGLDGRGVLDRYPIDLSGGQAQRVAIARAIIDEPEILLADEPMSAVDVTARVQILHALQEIRASHDARNGARNGERNSARYGARKTLSMIFVSHDIGMVQHIADRIVVLNHGRIVEQGSCRNVLGNPKHPYTKELLKAAAL